MRAVHLRTDLAPASGQVEELSRAAPPTPEAVATDATLPWRPLLLMMVGTFMAILDVFIVVVAAPAIQSDLHASDAQVQLILAGYQLTYAIALITGARLGDRYGRKRLFLSGMGLFTAASLGCGLAPDAGFLVGARLVQGIGAALMFPQVFSNIQVLVSDPPQRARAFAALGVVISLATIVGQVLGGALITAHLLGSHWRPVFWVNVPIGLVTIALAARFVPETRAPQARALDRPGAAVLTLALSLLVVPLIEGRQYGWPLWAWLSLAASVPAFVAFVLVERWVERRGGSPLLSLRLLREPPFRVGLALVLVTYAGINSFFLVLSLVLQNGLGLSPLSAGLVYTPEAIAFSTASILIGRYGQRLGARALQIGGTLLAGGYGATVLVAAIAGPHLTAAEIIPTIVVQGVGGGMLLTPLLNSVLARVDPHEMGMASGVLSTTQQVGGALGVAIVGVLFFGRLGSVTHGHTGSFAHALAVAVTFNFAAAALGTLLAILLPRVSPRKAAAS